MITADFLVIGGGVIGINIARNLRSKFPEASVHLLEKETTGSHHASGRNSGVLHAGFYYTADSLKAKFTRDGNKLLAAYCNEKGIPINRCGKLVVAQKEGELTGLDTLMQRGQQNGVELQTVTESEAREIEPCVKTVRRALYSPNTSSVDPVQVVTSMEKDACQEGVVFHRRSKYVKYKNGYVHTTSGVFSAGYVINAAGLYADKVARDFGFSEHYRILPFKGVFLYADAGVNIVRTNIYPVPDLNNPFLGVHFTVGVGGRIKIGPTAMPAFWREQYNGLDNFHLGEFTDIALRHIDLLFNAQFNFGQLAIEELRKYNRNYLVNLVSRVVDGVDRRQFREWGRAGIRAQLVNIKSKRLEMDFVLEGDERSFHVLNAVSPGFTCSLPFSDYVCDTVTKTIG